LTQEIRIERFAYSDRFRSEMRGLPPDVVRATKNALELLQRNPRARSLRLHPLTGLPKPTVWKINVFANHAWYFFNWGQIPINSGCVGTLG
jgi:hypothetical protein